MSDKPDLVFDEPSATGWLRAEFFGDAEAGKEHLGAARKQLGAMRSRYGVNERIANGEPGGFYRDSRVLPDGAYIETLTNDGHDTVRITVPKVEQPASEVWVGAGESTQFEGTPTAFDFTPEWPGKPTEPPEAPTATYRPYLWIGARIVAGDRNDFGFINRIHLCVFEAQGKGERDHVLSNRASLIGAHDPFAGPEVYPLQPVPNSLPPDAAGDGLIVYLDSGLTQYSTLQPEGYDLPMTCPADDPSDPDVVLWDEITVGDPDNALGLFDEAGLPIASSTTGNYIVKIMVKGDDCARLSPCTVELRILTGRVENDGYVTDDTHQFTITEFTDYRMGIMPFGWFGDVEPLSDNSCVACQQTAPDYGANPHGPHWWQGGATIFVPPDQIDVPAESLVSSIVVITDDLLIPTDDSGGAQPFEPAGFYGRADRCPACVEVITYYRSFGWDTQQGVEVISPPACPVGPPFFGVPWKPMYEVGWNDARQGQRFNEFFDNLITIYGLPSSTIARAEDGFELERHIGEEEGFTRYTNADAVMTYGPGECNVGVYSLGPATGEHARPPYDHLRGFAAYAKWSRAYDKNGNPIPGSEKAAWITKAEYEGIPYPLNEQGQPDYSPVLDPLEEGGGGYGDKVQSDCGRVERD